jgi:hypothetical protein
MIDRPHIVYYSRGNVARCAFPRRLQHRSKHAIVEASSAATRFLGSTICSTDERAACLDKHKPSLFVAFVVVSRTLPKPLGWVAAGPFEVDRAV